MLTLDATQLTDQHLVSCLVGGSQDAFKQLYFRYGDGLFRFLWRKTRSRETAEDLSQECFARLWKSRQTLNPQQSIKAWCYQVANNLAIDHLRKKTSGLEEVDGTLEILAPSTRLDEEAFQRRQHIRAAVSALPRAQRQVFWLSRHEGLTYSELAQVLGISCKTAETHMNRALKKLRISLRTLKDQN